MVEVFLLKVSSVLSVLRSCSDDKSGEICTLILYNTLTIQASCIPVYTAVPQSQEHERFGGENRCLLYSLRMDLKE